LASNATDLLQPTLVNAVGAADAKPIGQHGRTDAVEALRFWHQTIADDMNGGLIRDQQRSRKKIGFRFNSAVVRAVSLLC